MPSRAELPTRMLVAANRNATIGANWNEIHAKNLAPPADLVVTGAFAVIGLVVALGFAIAFPAPVDSAALFLAQFG